MTLKELKAKTKSTDGIKLPGANMLRNSDSPIVASAKMTNGSITVYESGFAIYNSNGAETVIRVDKCNGYTYHFADGDQHYPAEFFDGEDWTVLFILYGEDQLNSNRMRKERLHGVQSIDEIEDCADEQDMVASIEMSELDRLIKKELTDRQYQVYRLFYYDEYSQTEIAKTLGISVPSVSQSIQLIKKKLTKFKKYFA